MATQKFDRTGKRSEFLRARAAESWYNRQLRQVAQQVRLLLTGFAPDSSAEQLDVSALVTSLERYSVLLHPWAQSVARYMVADVARRNESAWKRMSAEIGKAVAKEAQEAPTGAILREIMESSAKLITSLPLKAAEEVHELVLANLSEGKRSSTLIPKIQALGAKTEARARLIARTETARCAAGLTMGRAMYAGSEGYIWRTSRDADVRESHAEMEGKYVRWDQVPQLSDGTRTHAGMIYNCRCYAEPIFKGLNDADL